MSIGDQGYRIDCQSFVRPTPCQCGGTGAFAVHLPHCLNKLHFELKGGGRHDDRAFLTRLFAAYRLAYEFRVEAYTDRANNILRATKFGH